jgi:hypothetical protein
MVFCTFEKAIFGLFSEGGSDQKNLSQKIKRFFILRKK